MDENPYVGKLWQAAWAIIVATALLVLVMASAQSNGLIVVDTHKTDLDVVMLAAATVVLTGVAVLIAIGTLWGFKELRDAAIKAAVEKADAIAELTATRRTDEIAPRLIEARIQGLTNFGPDSLVAAYAREPNPKGDQK